jgi:hypothetical protein
MFFNLSRPEYPSSPEAFQTALLWELLSPQKRKLPDGRYPIFSIRDGYDGKFNDRLRETKPRNEDDNGSWIDAMAHRIVTQEGRQEELVSSTIAENLTGSRTRSGNSCPAIPLNLWTALLQSPEGMAAKENPADLGAIVNQLYCLGDTSLSREPASHKWFKACAAINKQQWALQGIEAGVKKYYIDRIQQIELPSLDELPQKTYQPLPAWMEPDLVPFGWFKSSWDKLCRPEWVDALPPRRWSDWATCIIRAVVGCGFIWESYFFYELGKELYNDADPGEAARRLKLSPTPLVWNTELSHSERNIGSKIKKKARHGRAVSIFIEDELVKNYPELDGPSFKGDPDGLGNWIEICANIIKRENLKDNLKERLTSDAPQSNLEETIRYSLLCRESYGENADFYGLLSAHGTFSTCVEPGNEWLVTFTSLLCEEPSGTIKLGKVMQSLRQIGIDPNRKTLIKKLESCGLCRSSHDADDAIEVSSGF